jgi:hypothetical protein
MMVIVFGGGLHLIFAQATFLQSAASWKKKLGFKGKSVTPLMGFNRIAYCLC